MMSNKNNGGPAYPRVDGAGNYFSGMSLRDYFAAKAMASMLLWFEGDKKISYKKLCGWSFKIADAMLKARDEN